MEKILNSFKAPFKHGFFTGVFDLLFRFVAFVIWAATVQLLFRFAWEALFLDNLVGQRMWWLTYSAMMFIVITVLAYTAIWDRE